MAARQVMLVSSHVFLPLSDRQSYVGNILRLMPLRVNNQMCRRTVLGVYVSTRERRCGCTLQTSPLVDGIYMV